MPPKLPSSPNHDDPICTALERARRDLSCVRTFETRLAEHGVALEDCVETVDDFDIVLKVDDVDLCRAFARQPAKEPAGAAIRQSVISVEGKSRLIARENHLGALASVDVTPRQARRALLHLQSFRSRRRVFRDSMRGLKHTLRLVQAATTELGAAWALSLFLKAEREYWARECAAGAVAQQSQRRCGIGWGNAVRFVVAASRDHLPLTLEIFSALGCQPVSSQSVAYPIQLYSEAHGGALLLDVDLDPSETIEDVTTSPSPLVRLGRAGRWCALFGESLLEGGLVSVTGLYCQHFFDSVLPNWGFETAEDGGIVAERRAINPQRIASLLAEDHLDQASAETLRLFGSAANRLVCILSRGPDVDETNVVDLTDEFFLRLPTTQSDNARRRRRRLAPSRRNASRQGAS